MAIRQEGNTYYGLSTDAKPTGAVLNGREFREMDTGKKYLFDAENGEWLEQPEEGGGGGVLVVHEANRTLDHTWAEITSAPFCVLLVESGGGIMNFIILNSGSEDGSYFVSFYNYNFDTAATFTYTAASADGYPSR